MPNWCDNALEIEGTEERLQEFYEKVLGEYMTPTLSFEALVPMPQSEEDNWYDWRINNWGTKWDVATDAYCGTVPEDGFLLYDFSTAWGPCDEWVKNVAKLFPDLSFKLLYGELGMGFAGELLCEDGAVVKDEFYESDTPEYRAFVIENFGEEYLGEEEEEEE